MQVPPFLNPNLMVREKLATISRLFETQFLQQERHMIFSRRDMLAATAAGGVMAAATMTTADATPVKSDISFGNPNDPPPGAINAKNPRRISDPGPQNPAIRDQFPGAFSPPATADR